MFQGLHKFSHGRCLRLTICGLLVLALSGGPWFALQTIAWAGMLVKYSQAEGLARGITKTFDGQHPCNLCTSISKAVAQSQQDRDGQPKTVSFESVWQAVLPHTVIAPSPREPNFWQRFDDTADARYRTPPVPPPRA